MERWHIGPFYNSVNTKDNNDLRNKVSSFGLATGYQWIFNSHVILEILFGVGRLNIDSDNPEIPYLSDIR
jgi:hypothetical protein